MGAGYSGAQGKGVKQALKIAGWILGGLIGLAILVDLAFGLWALLGIYWIR